MAPAKRASIISSNPMGPCPITTTVSPAATRAFSTAFRQVFTGSTNVASSKAHARGNLHHAALDDPGHGAHVFGEAASIGIEARRQAHLLVARALREKAALAIKTVAAGNVVKTDHAVADFPAMHAASHGDHRSGNFVPENLGRRHEAVLYLFQVGAANAAGRHANQHFAVGNFRHGNVLRGHAARARDKRPRAFRRER